MLSFAEFLSEDKSFTVHHKNAQKLAIEMYKNKNELCPRIIRDLFKEVTHPYNLRNGLYVVLTKSKLSVMAQKPLPWSKNTINYSRRNKRIYIIRNFPSKNQVMETR